MNIEEAQDFTVRFVTGKYAPEEYAAFLLWVKKAKIDELTIVADTYELSSGFGASSTVPSAVWVAQLESKLDHLLDVALSKEQTVKDDRETRVRWLRRSAWMSAAAAVVVSAGVYLYVHQPGGRPADRAAREKLLSMTFSVERGDPQKELVLEDGSKIWLNAGSSLKYPAHFAGSERLVELSGEAFFEVNGNSQHPFKVLIRDAEMDVMGTSFSIMAYNDEPDSRTIVAEGALKIVSGLQEVVLSRGQEAELIYGSAGVGNEIRTRSGIDPKWIADWREGIYRFTGTELHVVMRELGRVYNVAVQYKPNVGNPPIDGILDLRKGLDVILKQMELVVPGIRFKHEGKIVIASSI